MITVEKLSQIIGKQAPTWVGLLNHYLKHYDIWTRLRVSGFIAQCAHESAGFTILEENLNYSQQGLRKVFPKYFPDDAIAFRYARQPVWIASKVYGGRMGNGAESTQDGYNYRGRGLIQLTGKDNYRLFSMYLFEDDRLLQNPNFVSTPEGAIQSACWFWTKNKLNLIADDDNIEKMTKVINGGTIGLEHRKELYVKCKSVFSEEDFR